MLGEKGIKDPRVDNQASNPKAPSYINNIQF